MHFIQPLRNFRLIFFPFSVVFLLIYLYLLDLPSEVSIRFALAFALAWLYIVWSQGLWNIALLSIALSSIAILRNLNIEAYSKAGLGGFCWNILMEWRFICNKICWSLRLEVSSISLLIALLFSFCCVLRS